MSVNSDHVTGFVVGLGAAALGFYLYKKNQTEVDQWLQQQGINIPHGDGRNEAKMSLEELMREKERLEDIIAFETSLTSVKNTSSGVTLHFDTPNGAEVWEAQAVVLALPFTALRKVGFEPALHAARWSIIESLPYTQVAQTYLQTATRFWSEQDNVLAVYSDGPIERLFNASSRMTSERGLLVNWVNGKGVAARG